MIVRSAGGVLHLISQPAHAALARRIMERWAPLHGAARRQPILLAVEEHDNGWHEPDTQPSVDPETGRVFDFMTIPAPVKQAVWPRGVARLASQDLWAAALVAEHALIIYARFRTNPAWNEFFETLTATRNTLVRRSGQSQPQLEHDYGYVRIGDLLSLVFCNECQEEQTYDRWQIRLQGATVMVTPDGFAGRELPIAVTAREIPDVVYASDAALQDAIRMAPRVTLHGIVSGAA
ncbi:MAG TPA: DUF3891 family protein [Vicinamibacterales bacterium]|nr:DUF3891 family protein [Vicinamibacterales bacterium]